LEANPEEMEAIVEWQEIPNEEATVHSMRAWGKEMMASQETTETRLACKEPTSVDIESETEHREASKEHAAVETDKAPSTRHRDWHVVARHCGKPKELSRGDCRSWRNLAAACRKVSRRARVAWHKRICFSILKWTL
jgi:hypothetical protein